jgi:hypothetical protein
MHHSNEPIDAVEQARREGLTAHSGHVAFESLECVGIESLGDDELGEILVDDPKVVLQLGDNLAHKSNKLEIEKVRHDE